MLGSCCPSNPLSSWECADCRQYFQHACGVCGVFLAPPLTATLAPKRREQQTQSLNAVLPPGPTLWVGLSTRAGNLAEIDRNRGIKKGPFRDILLDPMGPPFQDPQGDSWDSPNMLTSRHHHEIMFGINHPHLS